MYNKFLRPAWSYSNLAHKGWFEGFTKIDTSQPFLCFNEVFYFMQQAQKIYTKYDNSGHSSAIFNNWYDLFQTIPYKCNFFDSIWFTSLIVLFNVPFPNMINAFKTYWARVPMYLVSAFILIDVGFWDVANFSNLFIHFDTRNFFAIIGRHTNLNLWVAFIVLISAS